MKPSKLRRRIPKKDLDEYPTLVEGVPALVEHNWMRQILLAGERNSWNPPDWHKRVYGGQRNADS